MYHPHSYHKRSSITARHDYGLSSKPRNAARSLDEDNSPSTAPPQINKIMGTRHS
ncbi:hypothetical protein BofuT4_uP088850.1 [Botrytis cinerea T4]|uniref:Uncharacterized protein n=1 Tax=Botryotinia fuckeliana (strain T4) TaxID=999810 RepID=G2YFD8_BOTF4|nr:hypothetical protein BofuT4_uP088850.1 [Botrytis cinerea T4]